MKSEIAKGAAWMVTLRLSDRLLGLVSTVILARLLVADDFGLVAMAMTFIALIELAGAFSFDVVLIQHRDPQRAHYDTAWTLNVAFALLCAALTAAMSGPAAAFYAEPRLGPIMLVLAAGWALQGFENIGIVEFRRRMDFRRDFAFMFGRRLLAFAVTVSMAIAFRSYWALVAGQVVGRLASVGLSYAMQPYRPRFSLAARHELFSFSSWLLVSNLIGFALARLPHFITGRLYGPASLGLYTIAEDFARLPSTELSAPINRATFPGYARLAGDLEALRRVYLDVIGVSTAVTLPAAAGLAAVAVPLVDVVLGPKWREASTVLAILAVSGAIDLVNSNNNAAYLALGRTRLAAGLDAVRLTGLVACAAVFVPQLGFLGLPLACLGAAAVTVSVSYLAIRYTLQLRFRATLRAVWRQAFATIVMALVVHGFFGGRPAPGAAQALRQLLEGIASGVAIYAAILFGAWALAGRPAGAETFFINRAQDLLRRFGSGKAPG